MGRILGIDFGRARTGLALSDETQTIASPLQAWERKGQTGLFDCVKGIVAEYAVQQVVVGFPRNMDGSEGEVAEEVKKFKEELANSLRLPVVLWDERLSSVSARRFLKDNKLRTKKDKKVVDTISAVLILQGYLDSRRK
jgi:putative Holliday junction resolvase